MENKRLFVGNLNFKATESELRELFSQYGSVVSIKIKKDKGYALVEMSEESEAEAALANLDKTTLLEREMRISFEMKKKKAKKRTIENYRLKSEEFARKDAAKEMESSNGFSREGRKGGDFSKGNSFKRSERGESSRSFSRDGGMDRDFSKGRSFDRSDRRDSERGSSREERGDRDFSKRSYGRPERSESPRRFSGEGRDFSKGRSFDRPERRDSERGSSREERGDRDFSKRSYGRSERSESPRRFSGEGRDFSKERSFDRPKRSESSRSFSSEGEKREGFRKQAPRGERSERSHSTSRKTSFGSKKPGSRGNSLFKKD